MKRNLKNGTIEMIIFFIISPFLSLPIVLNQISKRDKIGIGLLAVFFGLLSYNYIPHITNDKARYYDRFEQFRNFGGDEFLNYLVVTKRPDFVFEGMLFGFSKIGLNIQFLFLFITTFTFYSIVYLTTEFVRNEFSKKSVSLDLWGLFLVIFSLSLGALFSGIRFYFGVSFFLWAIFLIFYKNSLVSGFLFLLTSVFTHFSLFFFLPLFLLYFIRIPPLLGKILLLFSLVFIFLPKDFLDSFVGFLEMPESYSTKMDVYLETEIETSENMKALTMIRNLWVYAGIIFLLLSKSRPVKLYTLLILALSLTNITFSIPLVYNRYLTIVKILFVAYLLLLRYNKILSPKFFILFFLLFLLSFFVDVMVLRNNIVESYEVEKILTIIHIISNKFTSDDFIY